MSSAEIAEEAIVGASTARLPWLPYLVDRADGVAGHFAIARWNPAGYREVWNLRRHAWGAFSDDVLTRSEAEKMFESISFHPNIPVLRGA